MNALVVAHAEVRKAEDEKWDARFKAVLKALGARGI